MWCNQKYYTILHWFPNHLLYIDHGNTKVSYIYTIEMRKSSLWKTSRWNARLIYTINKSNNENNNKNQASITKALEKCLVSTASLSIITKIFLLCTLNDIASFNFFKFCWFGESINALKFKVSASKGCCFCFLLLPNLWKTARQFKILAILYFYPFIIIFNLALQQVLLIIELTKAEIFVSKCLVSLFHLHLKIYNKNSLWRKSIRPFSSASSIYFFQGSFANWKHSITILWRYLKVIRKMFLKKQ